jgi:hypothetical protein
MDGVVLDMTDAAPHTMRDALLLASKKKKQISKHLCPKNVYSITYASAPKKMPKVDGFRPSFITFAPDEK